MLKATGSGLQGSGATGWYRLNELAHTKFGPKGSLGLKMATAALTTAIALGTLALTARVTGFRGLSGGLKEALVQEIAVSAFSMKLFLGC